MLIPFPLVRATYIYVVLHANPVHGESHNQHNTTREVAIFATSWARLVEITESERDKYNAN